MEKTKIGDEKNNEASVNSFQVNLKHFLFKQIFGRGRYRKRGNVTFMRR